MKPNISLFSVSYPSIYKTSIKLCSYTILLGLGFPQSVGATTYSITNNFSTMTAGSGNAISGTFSNVGSSSVNITINATSGGHYLTNFLLVPKVNSVINETSTVTITFSKAVSNVKVSVGAVSYNYTSSTNNVDEYIHSFNPSPVILSSYSSSHANASLITPTVKGASSAIFPSVSGTVYSGISGDTGGGTFTFPGNNLTSVSFVVESSGTTEGSCLIEKIEFDYSPPVSAPVDLKFSTQPQTFASEINLK